VEQQSRILLGLLGQIAAKFSRHLLPKITAAAAQAGYDSRVFSLIARPEGIGSGRKYLIRPLPQVGAIRRYLDDETKVRDGG